MQRPTYQLSLLTIPFAEGGLTEAASISPIVSSLTRAPCPIRASSLDRQSNQSALSGGNEVSERAYNWP